MTLRQTLDRLSQSFDHGDARLLLMAACHLSYTAMTLSMDQTLTEEQLARVHHMESRLLAGEPIQYVLGQWDFIDLTLKVDKRALIPRPETELLADLSVRFLTDRSSPRVMDIGCGTGCIGLYIKHKVPNAHVTLCDISKDALSLAKENAKDLSLAVDFIHSDMHRLGYIGGYDLIVSNPPYITTKAMGELDHTVLGFEPHLALHGGEDGLTCYRALRSIAERSLTADGMLAVEIGYDQGESVSQLFHETFEHIINHQDLEGKDRMVTARRRR